MASPPTRGSSTAPTSTRRRICRSTTSGPVTSRGTYTSAANIGVYLWAVVAAHDLKLISRQRADSLVTATLDEVSTLKRFDGFLYQWYDTNNGNVLANPGQGDCTGTTPEETDNCWFVSAVDNGWYASGPDRGPAGAARARRPGRQAAWRRWTSRSSTTTGRRRAATRTPRCPATPRPASSTAATTSTRGRPATTTARSTAIRGSRCTSGWACTRCRATSGGARGGRCRPSSARPTRTSPARASGRPPATGMSTPTRSRARSSTSGRATTSTRARP